MAGRRAQAGPRRNPDGPGSGGPRFKTRADDARGATPGSNGQQPYIPNDEDRQWVKDHSKTLGMVAMCNYLGCDPRTFKREYGRLMADERIKIAHGNGLRILKRAAEGDNGAQYFIAKTLGAWNREELFDEPVPPTESEAFAIPPEVLASLSDEDFAAYERICHLAHAADAGGAADRPEGAGSGSGDQGAA